ncbi:MAG: DUF1292 domain-containing protein [Clostridia bacterium]|nr:DUF1292 domain-containing protein [Clostridia bacterium]MBR3576731.1 DUF1292 domain-containing protein [Clostridia bacterium]
MNNIEEEDTIIVLTDEDGNDVEFEFLDNVEYEGNLYVVMIPVEDEDAGVVIMLLEEGETEEEDSLLTVTDEDVVEAVYEIFKENNKDVFEFEED